VKAVPKGLGHTILAKFQNSFASILHRETFGKKLIIHRKTNNARLNAFNFEKKNQNTILRINSLNIENKVVVFREKTR